MAEVQGRSPGSEPRRAAEIADATLALLVERGYEQLTVESVAERSGVNKTTIYRWWPSKAALVGAAIRRGRLLGFEVPDTGSLRGDLRVLVEHVVRLLTTEPTARLARTLLAGVTLSPELDEASRGFFADHLALDRIITERAAARGELEPRHADAALLVDLLIGAVWMRAVIRHDTVLPGFTDDIIDAVLRGVERTGVERTGGDPT